MAAHRIDFETDVQKRIDAAEAAGDTKRVGELETLRDRIHAGTIGLDGERQPSLLASNGQLPAITYTDGGRRNGLDEKILTGNYGMAGLVDSRPGHEFSWDRWASSLRPAVSLHPAVGRSHRACMPYGGPARSCPSSAGTQDPGSADLA